jgi:hypothetical protein
MTIPGVGPLVATAVVAWLGDCSQFKAARECAAYLGLVPKQYSSGSIERLGGISKRGNRYLRQLLVLGAKADLYAGQVRQSKERILAIDAWIRHGYKSREPDLHLLVHDLTMLAVGRVSAQIGAEYMSATFVIAVLTIAKTEESIYVETCCTSPHISTSSMYYLYEV